MQHHTILRCCLCFLVTCFCIVGLGKSLATPDQDAPPRQELWYWEGGTQLDHVAFTDMISEVLHIMPIVPRSEKLVQLLTETAATESSYGYAVRDKSGKTLGVYQILLSTAEYLMKRLERYPDVNAIVRGYMDPARTLGENLAHNLHFQTAMAVVYYWFRAGDDLLDRTMSLKARARLYKKEWNTRAGVATEAKYIRDSKRYLVSER